MSHLHEKGFGEDDDYDDEVLGDDAEFDDPDAFDDEDEYDEEYGGED